MHVRHIILPGTNDAVRALTNTGQHGTLAHGRCWQMFFALFVKPANRISVI